MNFKLAEPWIDVCHYAPESDTVFLCSAHAAGDVVGAIVHELCDRTLLRDLGISFPFPGEQLSTKKGSWCIEKPYLSDPQIFIL